MTILSCNDGGEMIQGDKDEVEMMLFRDGGEAREGSSEGRAEHQGNVGSRLVRGETDL